MLVNSREKMKERATVMNSQERFTIGSLYTGAIRHPAAQTGKPLPATDPSGRTFSEVLQQTNVQFSQHAQQRLAQRGISFEQEQLSKIEAAISKAAAKGARESLIMIEDVALIVNVRNHTVVTAVNDKAMDDHVFTQIDSAVIIR